MAITLQDVLAFIRRDDLGAGARQQIVETLNAQLRAKRREAKRGLYPRMRVQFTSTRTGRVVFGRIDKVNRVNVDLTEEGNGMKWRVSPNLLKQVDAAGKPVTDDEFSEEEEAALTLTQD